VKQYRKTIQKWGRSGTSGTTNFDCLWKSMDKTFSSIYVHLCSWLP